MVDNPTEQEAEYERGCEALRMGGFKLTPCRRYVLRKMITEAGPHSVASLLEAAGNKTRLDQSTIYRTLESFEQFGLIRQVVLASTRQTFFEWSRHGFHHHLVCTRCHRVEHLEVFAEGELESRVTTLSGYTMVRQHVEFDGLCPDCQSHAD